MMDLVGKLVRLLHIDLNASNVRAVILHGALGTVFVKAGGLGLAFLLSTKLVTSVMSGAALGLVGLWRLRLRSFLGDASKCPRCGWIRHTACPRSRAA